MGILIRLKMPKKVFVAVYYCYISAVTHIKLFNLIIYVCFVINVELLLY